MNCDQVQLLLNGYVDGELGLVESLDIERHLKDCPNCPKVYAELVSLHGAIAAQTPALYQPAPARLRQRINSSLRNAGEKEPARPRISWQQAGAAILAAIILMLVAGFVGNRLAQGHGNLLVDEIISAHVRSLMPNHLMDVASSDQHTVKPWFDGRINFSPQVVDLTPQGYPLIGGRLDYLDGHPSAVLVYQRNKHIINLFIWPTTNQVNGVKTTNDNGYNLFQWTQADMEYWAVSDLNTAEMLTFIRLYRAN
jgi:anti-sigma factor RsiW